MQTHTWTVNMMEPGLRDLQYKYNKIRYKACLKDIEKNFINGTKAWAKHKRLCEVDQQKYYEGFNTGREKTMFQEELKDLETVYKTALKNYAKEVEDVLPSLLYYMEKFLTVHKQNEAIREKLDVLLEKTGGQSQEEDGDDE